MALPENPGLAISGSVHLAVLALALLSFSQSPPLGDTQESIPVAILSNEQFNQIMKGEKAASQMNPLQRSEKLAQNSEPTRELSPIDAPKDVPAPPSTLKRQPDPGKAEVEESHPPRPIAPPPAQRPMKEIAASAPKSGPVRRPTPPPPKPAVDENAELAAAKPVAAKVPAERTKKTEPKFKSDQVAKLLDQIKQKEKQNSPARARSGDEAREPQHKFDLGDIAKFLNKEEAQRKQAAGQQLTQVASLGSPTASAAKMSPSLWGLLDGLLQEQYRKCWNFAPLAGQQKYVPEIHVQYAPDGALIGEPKLLNPSSDPNFRALAESAMRAVRRCDPLRIPVQYQPYYDQWKGRIVRFDPEEML